MRCSSGSELQPWSRRGQFWVRIQGKILKGCTVAGCVTGILYAHHDRRTSILHETSTPRIWDYAVEKTRLFHSMYSSFDRFWCLSLRHRSSFLKYLSRDVGFEATDRKDMHHVLGTFGDPGAPVMNSMYCTFGKKSEVVWYWEERVLNDKGYSYA